MDRRGLHVRDPTKTWLDRSSHAGGRYMIRSIGNGGRTDLSLWQSFPNSDLRVESRGYGSGKGGACAVDDDDGDDDEEDILTV